MQIRSRILPTAGVLLFLLTIASCSQSQAPADLAERTAPVDPLHGVWSMTQMTPSGGPTVNPSQPGLFIFTEEHYSGVYSLGEDQRPRSAASFSPTAEEKVAHYDTIIVNTGTYDASGSTITFRPQIAKSPDFVGGQSTADFQINGDVLTLTIQSVVSVDGVSAPDAAGSSMTFRRVE